VTTSAALASVPSDDPSTVDARSSVSTDELCDRYGDRVYQFARLASRSDLEAEDIAQTALERALRGLARFDPKKGDIEAWLWRIVVNVARDAGRAALRRQLLMERLMHFRRDRAVADDIPVGLDDDRLVEGIRALTALQRSVLALRYGADLEYRDVGALLGLSPGAATVAGHRALKALRRSLQEDL
jgi:RNA polymerase sigma-70 factor (ECF subfamily)